MSNEISVHFNGDGHVYNSCLAYVELVKMLPSLHVSVIEEFRKIPIVLHIPSPVEPGSSSTIKLTKSWIKLKLPILEECKVPQICYITHVKLSSS
jgi:hypothetical protein